MKVFIQVNRQKLPYSVNGYVAMAGFSQMGFEIIYFQRLAEVAALMEPADVVVGGIATVRERLSQLGIDSKELNYPQAIQKYLGRKIWLSDMDTINRKPELWPVFVKSVEGKKITGKVIRSTTDLIGLGSSYENPEIICSEVVDFVAEWRAYIRYGRVEGVHPYYGDWYYHYDPKVIEDCLRAYTNQPAGFSLDFGVTKEGKTLLVEVNDGYSLAAYGLSDIRYAKLLAARWAELTNTNDECAFDL